MTQINSNNHFKAALLLSVFLIIVVSVFLLIAGKNDSFQIINGYHDYFADLFFKYFTYAGDGWMWASLVIFFSFFQRKYLIAIIAGLVISTLLSQFLKRVVFVDDLRPITYLSENFPVHLIEGVNMNRLHSFPSGHSSTAITIALLLAYKINKKWWSLMLPILALLVGYSRVYLAQHFLTDVLAGMCVGVISALLSLMIYRSFLRHLNKKSS